MFRSILVALFLVISAGLSGDALAACEIDVSTLSANSTTVYWDADNCKGKKSTTARVKICIKRENSGGGTDVCAGDYQLLYFGTYVGSHHFVGLDSNEDYHVKAWYRRNIGVNKWKPFDSKQVIKTISGLN